MSYSYSDKRHKTILAKTQHQVIIDAKLIDINKDIEKYMSEKKEIKLILQELEHERFSLSRERKGLMKLEIDTTKFRVMF